MSTWIVRVTHKSRKDAQITVEADSYGDAQRAAQIIGEAAAPTGFDTFVDVISQEGEPWVDRIYACVGARPTVFVCQRALGHRFTMTEVALLKQRVREAGYNVIDHWNGEDCGTVSIGCSDVREWARFDMMSPEAIRVATILKQPRPET